MSLLEQLKKQKKDLKPCDTFVTLLSGEKYLERTKEGEMELLRLGDTFTGYVIDMKPDLQLAEICPFLYLGSQDPAFDIDLLTSRGITHVLSIGVGVPEEIQSKGIKYKYIELLDLPETNVLSIFDECFKFIGDVEKDVGNKVFIHCNAGFSRSPAVVIAYLMKTCRLNLKEAMNLVKEKRNVCPNKGFMKQLKKFESLLEMDESEK